jgi:hypothetical protein
LSDDTLIEEYQRRFNVSISSTREKELLNRFAWSASGHRFVERDEANDLWLPGQKDPAPVDALTDWTISRIRARAGEMLRRRPGDDPFERLVHEVFRSDSGRVPKLVMSLVGKIVNEVRRELR